MEPDYEDLRQRLEKMRERNRALAMQNLLAMQGAVNQLDSQTHDTRRGFSDVCHVRCRLPECEQYVAKDEKVAHEGLCNEHWSNFQSWVNRG